MKIFFENMPVLRGFGSKGGLDRGGPNPLFVETRRYAFEARGLGAWMPDPSIVPHCTPVYACRPFRGGKPRGWIMTGDRCPKMYQLQEQQPAPKSAIYAVQTQKFGVIHVEARGIGEARKMARRFRVGPDGVQRVRSTHPDE